MDLASFLPKLAEDEWEVILREAPRHLLVRAARERATTAREEDQPQLTLEPLPGTSTDVSLTTPATPLDHDHGTTHPDDYTFHHDHDNSPTHPDDPSNPYDFEHG
jgi:hypothetical protein